MLFGTDPACLIEISPDGSQAILLGAAPRAQLERIWSFEADRPAPEQRPITVSDFCVIVVEGFSPNVN
jgi:hypothetical protein